MQRRIRVFSTEDVERANDGRKRYGLRRYLYSYISGASVVYIGGNSRCSNECISCAGLEILP
jgi:hypothetical protein